MLAVAVAELIIPVQVVMAIMLVLDLMLVPKAATEPIDRTNTVAESAAVLVAVI